MTFMKLNSTWWWNDQFSLYNLVDVDNSTVLTNYGQYGWLRWQSTRFRKFQASHSLNLIDCWVVRCCCCSPSSALSIPLARCVPLSRTQALVYPPKQKPSKDRCTQEQSTRLVYCCDFGACQTQQPTNQFCGRTVSLPLQLDGGLFQRLQLSYPPHPNWSKGYSVGRNLNGFIWLLSCLLCGKPFNGMTPSQQLWRPHTNRSSKVKDHHQESSFQPVDWCVAGVVGNSTTNQQKCDSANRNPWLRPHPVDCQLVSKNCNSIIPRLSLINKKMSLSNNVLQHAYKEWCMRHAIMVNKAR
jgi:hypothetical protein